MQKILAVSFSSFTKINRAVFYALYDSGFDVTIVIPSKLKFGNNFMDPEPDDHPDVKAISLDLIGKSPRSHYFKGIIKLLNRLHPDVVYLENEPLSFLALQLGSWCKFHHAKLYCQSLENIPVSLSLSLKSKRLVSLLSFLFKKILSYAARHLVSHIFSINKDSAEIYRGLGFKRITQIPLGYDPKVFYINPEARSRIREKIKYNGIIIAYFGRIQKEKGVEHIIDALENLPGYDWRFLIDKFDKYKNEYSKIFYNKIENSSIFNRVIFFDANHYEMAEYMNASDIVLVPSYTTVKFKEQYGRVVQEAMACGNLVIVSTSGTLPELLGNCGLLVEENSSKAIEDQLRICLNDFNSFNHLREMAAIRASRDLTVNKQAEIISSVLQ